MQPMGIEASRPSRKVRRLEPPVPVSRAQVPASCCGRFGCVLLVLLVLATHLGVQEFLSCFPEVSMVLYAQCKDPGRAWNGKVGNFQVYKNAYENNREVTGYHGDDRRRRHLLQARNHSSSSSSSSSRG